MSNLLHSSKAGALMLMFVPLSLILSNWSLLVALLLCILLFYWHFKFRGSCNKEAVHVLSEEDMNAVISQWRPEPLVPVNMGDRDHFVQKEIIGKNATFVEIDNQLYLNLASTDFFSFIGNKRIEEIARQTIRKYGVGACGPRNFYGTVDVHLDLERQLANFLGCEETILYSYGFATIASALPAYSATDDIIFADKGVNFAIQQGLNASRSHVIWFNHNDVKHLEQLLEEQAKKDELNPKIASKRRRFIVVEGLYIKTADICPLPKLVEFKWRYKVRLFVDESLSFGVLGKNGRGVTEYFGIDLIDVDLIAATLENALATTGGFCAGRSYVIGHQRLSGLGYCFSASLPPALATAASEALHIMNEQPDIFARLQRNAHCLHQTIEDAIAGTGFKLIGDQISPLKHIGFEDESINKATANSKLETLCKKMFEQNILVARSQYLENNEAYSTFPTLKIICRSELGSAEIADIGKKLSTAIKLMEND